MVKQSDQESLEQFEQTCRTLSLSMNCQTSSDDRLMLKTANTFLDPLVTASQQGEVLTHSSVTK